MIFCLPNQFLFGATPTINNDWSLIKHWRSFGIRIFAFIDDGFGGGNSLEEATRCSNIVQSDLAKSGFIAHPTKSQWILKQEGEHLGFIVNLKDGVFSVPARRLLVLRKKLQRLAQGGKPTARTLASLVGTIISMGLLLECGLGLFIQSSTRLPFGTRR